MATRTKGALLSNKRIARVLRAAQSRFIFGNFAQHELMLSDSVRLDAYYEAIQRHVTPEDVVVDVGTGTGVLAFFAAHKQPRQLYALDHSARMIEYAKLIAAKNQIRGVTFASGHSSRFRPEEPVDVIVHEQMGDMLFQERMIENIVELRDRVLKPGGRILPARFEFFLEPVQLRPDKRIPFIEEQCIRGIRFVPAPVERKAAHRYRYIDTSDVEHLLCDPEPVFTFDLQTLAIESLPTRFSVRKPVQTAGELNGVCAYFRANLDDEISFSTGPGSPRTHWGMLLLRVPARLYQAGEEFEMTVDVPTLSEHNQWRWRIGSGAAQVVLA